MKLSHQLIDFLLFACRRKKLESFQYRQSAQIAKILDYIKHIKNFVFLPIQEAKWIWCFWSFSSLFSSNGNGTKSAFIPSRQLVSWWEVFGGNHYRYHPRRRSVWINNGQLYSRYSSIYRYYYYVTTRVLQNESFGSFHILFSFLFVHKERRDDDVRVRLEKSSFFSRLFFAPLSVFLTTPLKVS